MAEQTDQNQAMIEAVRLSKFYGDFAAARDVTFSVPRGQVCAFLGPNGAGKSTTMKMLTGYLAPSEGEARIGGFDVSTDRLKAAEILGYLPEDGPLYAEMTPESFLKYAGETRLMSPGRLAERLDYVAEQCGLGDVWGKPTSGLDPNQVHGVRELIRRLGETKTVLLSTHILQEVHAVCSRVILISEGRLVFDGSREELGAEGTAMEEKFRELTAAASTH